MCSDLKQYQSLIESVQQLDETGWSGIVSGWCRGSNSSPVFVHLYLAGIKIRSQLASGTGANGDNYFTFYIGRNTISHLPENSEIEVRIDGSEQLCEFGDGVARHIKGKSSDNGEKLISMLSGDFHIDHWGNMHKPFGRNPHLIDVLMGFYDFWRDYFEDNFEKKIFLIGGNLLGLVRDGKFLDHDDDLDVGIGFFADTFESAVDQFFQFFEKVAPHIVGMGYSVKILNVGHFQIIRKDDHAVLDVFLCWTNSKLEYFRYIGVGGYYGSSQIGIEVSSYRGKKVYFPGKPEVELELSYGPNWGVPDPNFVWRIPTEIKEMFKRSTGYGWKKYKALSETY